MEDMAPNTSSQMVFEVVPSKLLPAYQSNMEMQMVVGKVDSDHSFA
jgi:hypothetical protein